ncbi:MAG: membrane protein insertase YidC [Candidatus Hydrogenedentota bacterium]
MLDDDNDKKVARSQAIGLALMTLLLVMSLQYLFPSQPANTPPAGQTQPQQAGGVQSQTATDAASTGSLTVSDEFALPPVPAESEIENLQPVILENSNLRLSLTPVGARVQHAELLVDKLDLVPQTLVAAGETPVYPLGLRFSDPAIRDELDRRLFTLEKQDAKSATFALAVPGFATIRKTYTLTDNPYVVTVTIACENTGADRRVLGRDDGTPAYVLNWGPRLDTPVKNGAPSTLIWRDAGEKYYLVTSKFDPNTPGPERAVRTASLEWVALKSAYFLAAFKPEFEGARPWCLGTYDAYRFGMTVPRIQLDAGQASEHTFQVYLGPNHEEQLAAAWPSLDSALFFFQYPRLMDLFSKFLLNMLNWFHGVIPNYGVAIILMTLVVRAAMIPLTIKQMRSMKGMQLLQPEMEAIREKYKDEPQVMQQKIMEMYRERGVNPLGGCFPLLLQMPIFFAFYRMLWYAYELYGAPFLWIKDLSAPDSLFALPAFFQLVPFFGKYLDHFHLLPLLNIGVMILSVRMMPQTGPMQNPQQRMMMTIMPVVFGLICYPFAAGLNLYILVSTVIGILQNKIIRVSAEDIPEKKRTKKKQNMYSAYQARKREQKKFEAKKKTGEKEKAPK